MDKHDNVWVHNILNHKLHKFDSYLNLLQTWDGHETDFTQEGNTIGFSSDKSVVYWYKGKHECLMIDAATNETIDTIDYLIDDVPVVKGLLGLKDTNTLLVITCNHSGEDAKLLLFDLKKHKPLQKTGFAKITENIGHKISNWAVLPDAKVVLVGATNGEKPKSVVSVIAVNELKLLDQMVSEQSLPIFNGVPFGNDFLVLSGENSIHLAEFDPKTRKLKLVCRDVCTVAGSLQNIMANKDFSKLVATSNRGRVACLSLKST